MLWGLLAIVIAAGSAFGMPWLAKHIPWRMERWMANVVGGVPLTNARTGHSHPESLVLFRTLVKRLYPLYPDDSRLPVTIEVIPGKTVNAFATLGGHIYVFEGLLEQAQSAEELAGVLAHEIEHVRNRHIIQGVAVSLFTVGALNIVLAGDHQAGSRMARLLVMLKFSRQQEYQADELGLRRLQAAQVDAGGFQRFFARAEKLPAPPEILANHPANEFRARLAARFRGYPVDPIMDSQQWAVLRTICQ